MNPIATDVMDPTPTNQSIISQVMEPLPAALTHSSTSPDTDFDMEDPRTPSPPPESEETPDCFFEVSDRMPELKNPELISAIQDAVNDVAQSRSVLEALGARPDHETLDVARSRLSEIDADEAVEDYEACKAVIGLDEMHESYEKILAEAERKLERYHEAVVAGADTAEECAVGEASEGNTEDTVNEEVAAILKAAEAGKKAIERVDLSGRKLKVMPEEFGRLKLLIVLNFSYNLLEEIPDSIGGLENLEELIVAANQLESLPDSIGLLQNLKILNVSANKLASLPDSICNCRSLEELDASYNKLTYLPTNIGLELTNLKRLHVHLNKIRSLPTSIGDMRSLRLLDVHFNELHTIPSTIGKLTNLETLDLSSNFSDLTELPETISNIISLRVLDLSNNQIRALPSTFSRLLHLMKLNLDGNPLEIPPKSVAAAGLTAVMTYMTKRWVDMLMDVDDEKSMLFVKKEEEVGLLSSWLRRAVSAIGTLGQSNADHHLNQDY